MKKSEKIEWLAQQLWEQTQSKKRFESAWKDEYKKRKALEEENSRLRHAYDIANMQLQGARESLESAQCANKKLRDENTKLEQELRSSKALASELGKENAHLRTENDIARAQLQDAQEKMRKPVFVPIK